MARAACSLPFSMASSKSRKSEDTPDTPITPDFLLRMSSISSMPSLYLFIRYWRMPASMSPTRVPMGRPATGVKPMEVSTLFPPSTAVTEEPLPRWQVMIFSSPAGLPSISAARAATYMWEVPWNPYRRTLSVL
ncbi:hypothetical protein SDC9_151799 [bioreactor metagenome]|uniref:Uncharacterized protein n=1 Tax=bioreactor metagenome TaxID=1076179 RepID=A0A645ERA2_9ZZZZ